MHRAEGDIAVSLPEAELTIENDRAGVETGKWLVGSTILFSISTQVQAFLAVAILGPSAP